MSVGASEAGPSIAGYVTSQNLSATSFDKQRPFLVVYPQDGILCQDGRSVADAIMDREPKLQEAREVIKKN